MADEVVGGAVPPNEPPGAAQAALPLSEGAEKPAGTNGAGLGTEAARSDEPVGERALWPDDWRERLAGKDEKELSRLKRWKDPENVYRSLRSLEQKVSSGFYRAALSEGASEQEVTEYNKAHGIPEEPTAEGYGLSWPEGYEATEADNADLAGFLGEMHGAHIPAQTVQKVWQAYIGLQTKAAEELQVAAALKSDEYKAEVRSKYMTENGRFDRARFERDVRLGNNYLAEHLGEERSQEITALTLADGTKLGDNPLFYELFTSAALKVADDESLWNMGNGAGTAVGSIDDQYQAALALADTDPKAYHSPAHQQKLVKLAAAKARKAA